MNVHSIGDQARAFALQAASHRLKSSLDTLTRELASGEVADIGQRLQGNTQILNQIETRIGLFDQFNRNAAEAALLTKGMQDVLESVHAETGAMARSLVVQPVAESSGLLAMRADEVAQAFQTTVARLNGAVGGRFLFSGLNSGEPALAPAAQILDAIEASVAGLTSAADIAQAVSDWFDAPQGGGGFMDVAYRGTVGMAQRIEIADAQSIGLSVSAATPALRDVLKGLATSAMAGRGVLAGQHGAQRELMQRGGQILLSNETPLLGEMGRIGLQQQIIERARTETAASTATLQITRNELRSADPYATAGALQQVSSQLEALYAVSARLSNLNLVDFLR